MSQRVLQLVQKVKVAVDPIVAKARAETVKNYDALMKANEQYVVKDPVAADKLLKQYIFTQLSRAPATIAAVEAEAAAAKTRLSQYREMPVSEMATYLAFGGEVFAWFVVGEIVGRGFTFSGYDF